MVRGRAARLAGWVRGGPTRRRRWARLAALVAAAWLAARVIVAAPGLLWALAAWFTITTWRAGTTPNPEPTAEPEPAEVEEQHRAALLAWLGEITAGRNGVHLAELYATLRERPALADLDDTQLRAMLDRYRVPVTRTLSVDGIAGKSGVRRADIKALLHPAPPEGGDVPSRGESGPDVESLTEQQPDSHPLSPGSHPALTRAQPGEDTTTADWGEHIADALDVVHPTTDHAIGRTA